MTATVRSIATPQNYLSDEQVAVCRRTIWRGFSDANVEEAVWFCRSRGVNPLAGQVAITLRKWTDKRTGKPMEALSKQTTIDGLRSIAAGTGELDGQDDPEWLDSSGKWVDCWTQKGSPVAARVRVYRKGSTRPYPAVCLFADYDQGGGWWRKSGGAHMIAKCAEAAALRKAFPERMSGLHTDDEMAQAVNDETPVESRFSAPPWPASEAVAAEVVAGAPEHVVIRMARARTMAEYQALKDERGALHGDERDLAMKVHKAHLLHIKTGDAASCACEAMARTLLPGAANAEEEGGDDF